MTPAHRAVRFSFLSAGALAWALTWTLTACVACLAVAASAADAPKTPRAKPDAAKPADATKPDVAKPNGGKPDAGKPADAKPDATKPDAGKPGDAKPDAPKPAAPAPRPATSIKPGGERALLQQAATALIQEFQKAARSKDGTGLREKSDYFTVNKVEGLTPEMILAALERPVNSDPRVDSYVKWQYLSAIEGKVPPELVPRLLRIYRAAPRPATHPGLDKMNLERALNRVGIMRKEMEAEVNREYGDAVTRYRLNIEPILAYRDELYARLPVGFDAFAAALQDIYDRVNRGAPANEFWSNLNTAMRSWAVTASDAKKLEQLAGGVENLLAAVRDDRNKPYGRVGWTDSTNYTGLKWYPEQTIAQDKSLEEAASFLKERAANPSAGGLNFKDEKK